MENGRRNSVFSREKKVIVHCYVSLPQGIIRGCFYIPIFILCIACTSHDLLYSPGKREQKTMVTNLERVGRIDTRALFEGSCTDTPGIYSIFEFSCMLRPSRTNFFGMGMCSHVLCSSMLLIRV